MQAFAMGMAISVALVWAAAAQVPGFSETRNGRIAPDLGSGVQSLTASPNSAQSKPGGSGYGISGGGSEGAATSYGDYGTGRGAAGRRPANTGAAPSR